MDPRIADFIRANRETYTRQAIRERLINAGHDPAAIDATWAALETPDPDAVVGEAFWGRFWLFLVGLNVAVFVVVFLLTGMVNSVVLAVVLGIALAIGALIAWGIVVATGPTKMGRTTAMAIGGVIPIIFALLIGGSCYALVGAIGPPPPPPNSGVMELQIGPPLEFQATGAAYCQTFEGGTGFNVYPQQELGTINGRAIHASVDSFPVDGGPEGGPAPAPAPGVEGRPSLNMYVSLQPRSESDPPQEWYIGPNTQVEMDASADGLSGTATFEGLEAVQFEPGGGVGAPISGSISWECEGDAGR